MCGTNFPDGAIIVDRETKTSLVGKYLRELGEGQGFWLTVRDGWCHVRKDNVVCEVTSRGAAVRLVELGRRRAKEFWEEREKQWNREKSEKELFRGRYRHMAELGLEPDAPLPSDDPLRNLMLVVEVPRIELMLDVPPPAPAPLALPAPTSFWDVMLPTITELRKEGLTARQIGDRLGMSPANVFAILTRAGMTFTDLDSSLGHEPKVATTDVGANWDEHIPEVIRLRVEEGLKMAEIAERLGVTFGALAAALSYRGIRLSELRRTDDRNRPGRARDEKLEELATRAVALTKKGLTWRQAAAQLGVAPGRLAQILRRNGIEVDGLSAESWNKARTAAAVDLAREVPEVPAEIRQAAARNVARGDWTIEQAKEALAGKPEHDMGIPISEQDQGVKSSRMAVCAKDAQTESAVEDVPAPPDDQSDEAKIARYLAEKGATKLRPGRTFGALKWGPEPHFVVTDRT